MASVRALTSEKEEDRAKTFFNSQQHQPNYFAALINVCKLINRAKWIGSSSGGATSGTLCEYCLKKSKLMSIGDELEMAERKSWEQRDACLTIYLFAALSSLSPSFPSFSLRPNGRQWPPACERWWSTIDGRWMDGWVASWLIAIIVRGTLLKKKKKRQQQWKLLLLLGRSPIRGVPLLKSMQVFKKKKEEKVYH